MLKDGEIEEFFPILRYFAQEWVMFLDVCVAVKLHIE